MANEAKIIRGQVRQAVKEILAEVLGTEVMQVLTKRIEDRLNHIDGAVKTGLEEMNQRTKDTQDYVVRNLALAQVKTVTPSDETAAKQ